MKLRSLLFIGSLFFVKIASSQNNNHHFTAAPDLNGLRSDTVDVLSYTINLNVTDFTTDTLRGNTVIRFAPKMNGIKTLSLDLQHFTVDSVKMNSVQLVFAYNDTLLVSNLPATENIGDTNYITVYYHGSPVTDPSGWGGFYFQAPYAYNLGVGFTVQPHNFGRAWYPCFDNFKAKSTFVFHITTDTSNLSFCNGYLAKDSVSGALRFRTWIMNDKISSYHACVDVAPYVSIRDTFYGIDTLPILINGLAADTSNIRKSFIHLKNAISTYESCYGKYPWNKIGYSMVPFNSGAMEHPSNIAYPLICANGTTNNEANIMAHELSHHWCGDLVTCSSAGDMWLNEGFAVFNQSIFMEHVYGETTYNNYARENHDNVIHYCAIADHGYWPLSGMPQPYTYGDLNFWVSTTYQKGADVFHTLRTYLGDSNFFNGLKYYFSAHKFQPVNADTLKNSLQRYSGYNLTDFFNDWVFAPGFPQFSIDSTKASPNGPNYNVTIYIKQRLVGAPNYYTNVPLDVTFKSSAWVTNTQTFLCSGQTSSYTFTVPFNPVFTGLDLKFKIAEAISSDTLTIKKTGSYTLTNSRVYLGVSSINDSAFLFIEHNYAAPDPVKNTNLHYRISPNRYWKISGILPTGFKAILQLDFDGRKDADADGNYYLDTSLTMFTRDSIMLLYRPNAGTDWTECKAYSRHFFGTATDMNGYMSVDSLQLGEYAFANGVSTVLGINEHTPVITSMKLFPNPASDNFTIALTPSPGKQYISIYNMQGQLLKQITVNANQQNCLVPTLGWKNGTYLVSLDNGYKTLATQPIVISH